MFFKRDVLGNIVFIKKALVLLIGVLVYPRYKWVNKTKIEGMEHLENLPCKNVLFVSNHQTYFADVMAIFLSLYSFKRGYKNKIASPLCLFNPKINMYFVAAEETMKAGLVPKILAYTGSVSIKRTWREAGKDINRKVSFLDISNIGTALGDGWVITFPQGTTTPFVKGRRGTSLIVKKYKPVVVPVVINGFRRGFDKKGLKLKKKGIELSIRFKKPLDIKFDSDSDKLLEQIMHAIEQSEAFQ